MKNKLIKILIFPILGVSLFCSCNKFVEVDLPIDRLTADTIFKSPKLATAAVTGLYDGMINTNPSYFGNFVLTICPGLSADEIYQSFVLDPGYDELYKNEISTANSFVANDIWRYAYKYIFQANTCIKGLKETKSLAPALQNQLLGESLFFRSFSYFYLTNLFDKVPLITDVDYKVNQSIARTDTAKIYDQIIEDLTTAYNLLLPTYPSTGKFRPNKWTVASLLSRVYLYRKDWVNAEKFATAVIDSKAYKLTSLESIFSKANTEAIWQLEPYTTFTIMDVNYFVPFPGSEPFFPITNSLVNSFETGDKRKNTYINKVTIGTETYYYPNKFRVSNPTTLTEFVTPFRFAEMYLIRSEARINQDNNLGSLSDLDSIRNRASLPLMTVTNPGMQKVDIINLIENENRIEFLMEWGHRWFDLKRTGRVATVIQKEKPGMWQSKDALYPIPKTEIELNPALKQNPDYQ